MSKNKRTFQVIDPLMQANSVVVDTRDSWINLHQGHDDMVELTVPQFDALARELGYVKAGEGQ